jgi:DNA-binding response OmpR family regulator
MHKHNTLHSFLQASDAIGTPSPSRKRTILLVDDDPAVRQLAAAALEKEGYKLLIAEDVGRAIEIAGNWTHTIDLLMTDVVLPSGNGIALARAFLAKRPDVPVLYISGFEPDVLRSVQDGGGPDGSFLEKPFLPSVLVTRVGEILSRSEYNKHSISVEEESSPPAAPLVQSDAAYRLERPVRCSQCGETIMTLHAVRLLRTQVNFTSTLPRRGRVLVCPNCQTMVPAELTSL